jgi:hypothetical protein
MSEYSPHRTQPISEVEAFIGNIIGKNGAQSKRQRELSISMRDRVDREMNYTINCIIADEGRRSNETLERSMACLSVSLEEWGKQRTGKRLKSFGYVAAAVCLDEVERYCHRVYGDFVF